MTPFQNIFKLLDVCIFNWWLRFFLLFFLSFFPFFIYFFPKFTLQSIMIPSFLSTHKWFPTPPSYSLPMGSRMQLSNFDVFIVQIYNALIVTPLIVNFSTVPTQWHFTRWYFTQHLISQNPPLIRIFHLSESSIDNHFQDLNNQILQCSMALTIIDCPHKTTQDFSTCVMRNFP